MRGDLIPYFRDRSECNQKRLSTKAGDIRVLTEKRHTELSSPETVLMRGHKSINRAITTNVDLASRREREDGRWWWTGNGRRYGVSTILNQSAAKLPTQPPVKPWPISHPAVTLLEPPVSPPIIDSTSTFKPLRIIQSMEEPKKYWRRKLLPLDVLHPPAKLVAGMNMDSSITLRGGQDANEAKAIQAASECTKRVKEEKIRKLRAASRGIW